VRREVEVALTEEFETTMAAQPEDRAVGDAHGEPAVIDLTEVREGEAVRAAAVDAGAALGAAKIPHATRERGRARELFEQLATLPDGDEERQRIRG